MNDLTQSFLRVASPEFQPIVIRLTEIIESSKEPLSCDVKWGQLTYAKNGDFHHWLLGIKVTKKFVGLVFHFGGLLDDPQGIFICGTSKFSRKIEYRRVEEVESEVILVFLEQALEKVAYFKEHFYGDRTRACPVMPMDLWSGTSMGSASCIMGEIPGCFKLCSVIFLSALLAGLFSAIAHIFKRGDRAAQSVSAQFARRIALMVAFLDLSALVAFLVVCLDRDGFGAMIAYGEMSTINLILIVWLAAAALTIGVAALTITAWKQGFWGRMARIHYSLIALAALSFVWFLNYWNLLGFRY